jgi:hypothetical protein
MQTNSVALGELSLFVVLKDECVLLYITLVWYSGTSSFQLWSYLYITESKLCQQKISPATTFMENHVESKKKIGFSIKFLSDKQRNGSKRNSKKHCYIQS